MSNLSGHPELRRLRYQDAHHDELVAELHETAQGYDDAFRARLRKRLRVFRDAGSKVLHGGTIMARWPSVGAVSGIMIDSANKQEGWQELIHLAVPENFAPRGFPVTLAYDQWSERIVFTIDGDGAFGWSLLSNLNPAHEGD